KKYTSAQGVAACGKLGDGFDGDLDLGRPGQRKIARGRLVSEQMLRIRTLVVDRHPAGMVLLEDGIVGIELVVRGHPIDVRGGSIPKRLEHGLDDADRGPSPSTGIR